MNMDANKLFRTSTSLKIRSSGENLEVRKQVQLESTIFFFTNGVVREWNKLPPSMSQCDTITSFKNKPGHHLLK